MKKTIDQLIKDVVKFTESDGFLIPLILLSTVVLTGLLAVIIVWLLIHHTWLFVVPCVVAVLWWVLDAHKRTLNS